MKETDGMPVVPEMVSSIISTDRMPLLPLDDPFPPHCLEIGQGVDDPWNHRVHPVDGGIDQTTMISKCDETQFYDERILAPLVWEQRVEYKYRVREVCVGCRRPILSTCRIHAESGSAADM